MRVHSSHRVQLRSRRSVGRGSLAPWGHPAATHTLRSQQALRRPSSKLLGANARPERATAGAEHAQLCRTLWSRTWTAQHSVPLLKPANTPAIAFRAQRQCAPAQARAIADEQPRAHPSRGRSTSTHFAHSRSRQYALARAFRALLASAAMWLLRPRTHPVLAGPRRGHERKHLTCCICPCPAALSVQVVPSAVIIERLRDESSDPSTGPYRDLVWGQPDGDGDTSSLSTSIDTLSGNPYLTLYELQGVTHNVTSNGVVTPVQPQLDGTSAQAVAEAIANGATVPTQPQQATEVAAMQHSKIDRANSVPLFPPEQQQAAQSDTASPEPPLPQQPSQPVQAAGSVQPGKAQRSRRRQQQPRSRAGWAAAPSPAAAAVSLEAALLRLEQAAQALRTSPPPQQHQGVQGEQTVPPVVQDTAQSVPRSHRRRRAAAAQAPTKQQADSSAAPEHPTAAPHTTSHTGHGSGPLQRIQQLAVADAPAALTLYKQHRDHLSKPHVVALWEWLGRYARHRSAAAAPSGAAAAGVLQLEWDALRLWGGLVEQTVFHTPRLTVADIERVLVVHRGLNGQLGSWFESGSGAIAGRGASTAGGEQYMAGPAATDAAAAAHAHAHQQAHPRPNRLHGVEDLHPFQAAAREARDPAAMWVCDMPASVTLSSPEPSPPPPDSYSLATQPLSPLPETQQAHTDSQQHAPVPDVHAASAAAATQEPVHHTVQHSQSNGSGSIPQHRTSTVQQRAAVTLPPGLGRASVQAFESALFTAAQPLFPAASLTQLTSLLRSAVQLQLRLPARVADGWWAAWWAASTPLVATGTPQCVVSLLRSVGYNTGDSGVGVAVAEPGSQQQPQQRPGRSRSRRAAAAAAAAATASAAAPPPAAMAAVLKAVQPLLAELPLQQLCQVAHAAATLSPAPPLAWRESLVSNPARLVFDVSCRVRMLNRHAHDEQCEHSCVPEMCPQVRAVTAQFDSLDAPAYALTLHALGRMRHRPSDRWVRVRDTQRHGCIHQDLCKYEARSTKLRGKEPCVCVCVTQVAK